ncbi:MAG TPA: 3',5'-cyclic adenosine monophosphate phosphodiesterase CpdA [Gammaproteobacteria bacterium]|nr:3',5'-cyclic adenosine monophosphate phosphodiesterase CpdA [Gammaproteobacteria bacterium]
MNHLIQISDCHIGDSELSMGVNSHQNLTNIIKQISTVKSDALLISGDLAHNGTVKSYEILKHILTPIQSDIFILSGNHDDANNLSTVFNKNLFNQFSLGVWEVISVDSVQVDKTSGYLTRQALIELDKRLKNSNAKYNLVVLHHPIVPMNSNWDDSLSLENPKDLFEVLVKYPKIQAVLFGHAHEAAEFSQDNIRIISCPSTALQFNNESRIGFNHYTLHDNGQLDYDTQWL